MSERAPWFAAPGAVEDSVIEADYERPAHLAAVRGTEDDPVRVTLCGKTLSDRRHRQTRDGLCSVCACIRDGLIERGLWQ